MAADMLSDTQIRNTKPREEIIRLWDCRGESRVTVNQASIQGPLRTA